MYLKTARRGERGFGAGGVGLLVILIALCIILYMMFGNGGSGKSYVQGIQAGRNNARELKADIQTYGFTQLIVAYHAQNGKLPKTAEELGEEASLRDPWGNQMSFTYQPENGKTFVVYHSNGPDGQPNTQDDIIKRDQLPI
jgi:hypothetical protein